MSEKMHKIAIALYTTFGSYDDYDDYNQHKMMESITEWEEVNDETFKLLTSAASRLSFTVIEQPTDIKKFIVKTIADWKKIAIEDEEKREQIKKEREAKALEKKLKKEAKTLTDKKKLFELLKQELGEQ